MRNPRTDQERYAMARLFLSHMRAFKHRLTDQQYSTLKGQALHGDIDAAWKGFWKIIRGGDAN